MRKIILSSCISISGFLVSDGQDIPFRYSVYINLAVDPSLFGFNKHIFTFRADTLTIINRRKETCYFRDLLKETYDSSYYRLSAADLDTIIKTIHSTDTLYSCFNFCIMDGTRFFF